jgi:glycosyltransferase involved in cell wall biosynthesis
MKPLFVLHSHGRGGAETHLFDLAQTLKRRGHAPAYAGPAESWLMERFRAAGFPGDDLPMHGFYDPVSMVRLAWIARRRGADLIHGHLTRGARYAGIGGRLTGLPVVATAHSTNAGKHFGRADRLIAVSGAVQRFLVQQGYDAQRISVVYNGAADPLTRPVQSTLRLRLHLPADAILFGVLARFLRDKGQDVAMSALSHCDPRVHLALIGDPATPWGLAMREQARTAGVVGRVHFLGFSDMAPQLIRELDGLLVPSRREALSLALIEAAAAGLPVIAARVGGIPEVVVDEETGLLVPSEDAAALAAAMGRLAADPALRERFGLNGRVRFLRHFSLETMADGVEAVYRQALAGARR